MTFIKDIAALVQKYAPQYGICVYSPVIAQACLESGYGTSELARNANNYFGLKFKRAVSKDHYIKVGSEQNPDGSYTSSVMKWCKFDNMEEGVKGYFDFISAERYAGLKGLTDPEAYLKTIKAAGYATSHKYVENLMNVIKENNLTVYDPEVKGLENKGEKTMAKVFLSAGHGGSDPGAVANGLREKDINLQVLLSCKEELERHGVTAVCSRTTDANDPVSDEVKEANAAGADLAVSFHCNAGGGDGFEAFYYSGSSNGKKLAQCLEKRVKALGQNSRGLKTGDHLYFVRKTTMTAVLAESFFVDNLADMQIGDTLAEQKAFGVAYAKGILDYLGISYRTPIDPGKIYRVQVGAYRERKNAEAMRDNLKAAGYDAFIV